MMLCRRAQPSSTASGTTPTDLVVGSAYKPGSTRRRPPTGACGFLPRRRIARNEVHGRSLKRVTEFMTGTTFRVNGDATRAEFLSGWAAIVQFLARKWAREPDYRLIKEPVKWEVAPECRLSGRSPCALLWAP